MEKRRKGGGSDKMGALAFIWSLVDVAAILFLLTVAAPWVVARLFNTSVWNGLIIVAIGFCFWESKRRAKELECRKKEKGIYDFDWEG